MPKKSLPLLLAVLLALPASSCGTLIFPERQDQPQSRRLDPNILILDGIGLLFWIVPGVVAYIVDFATGTIWLPPEVERGEGPFIHD